MANEDDNSASVLKAIASTIREHVKKAKKANKESLNSFRAAGAKLVEAKAVLKRGKFGRWVWDEFGYTRKWSSPLMKLVAESDRIDLALEWAGERENTPGTRKKFTVEGVFLLLREKEEFDLALATNNVAPPPVPKKDTPKERAAKELAAAKRRIDILERALVANNLAVPEEQPEEPDPKLSGKPVHPVGELENPIPDSKQPSEPKDSTPDDREPEGPAEPPQPGPQV